MSDTPKAVATAPEAIYIQISDEEDDMDRDFPDDHEDVTWCQGSVTLAEVPYIRRDIHERELAKVAAERDELRAVLMELRTRLHVQGRRPEECYEMRLIDTAIVCGHEG